MTDLRQAAQQALEALEELDGLDTETECVTIDVGDVIAALRTALEQQAELTCPECKAAVLYECVACSSNNYPPQQQAEPPPEWPLIKNILAVFGLDAIAFVTAWKAAQRPWVGLTSEEILDLFDRNNVYGSKWIEFARTVEAKLKEKNDH